MDGKVSQCYQGFNNFGTPNKTSRSIHYIYICIQVMAFHHRKSFTGNLSRAFEKTPPLGEKLDEIRQIDGDRYSPKVVAIVVGAMINQDWEWRSDPIDPFTTRCIEFCRNFHKIYQYFTNS